MSSGTLFVEINQYLFSEKTKLKIEVTKGIKKIETSITSF
jgi:hypothetical protein